MAKRRPKKHVKKQSRRILPRRVRGPVLLAAAAVAAVAGVVVLVVLGMSTQSEGAIERLEGINAVGRSLGDANAPVTIIEFADYQCPACKRFEQDIANDLQEQYISTGLAKLEFRNLPIIGGESFLAAEAAQCADDQGKFWEYHDLLFEAQRGENSGTFSSERLVDLAREAGLDVATFTQCMADSKHRQLVQDEADVAMDAGARGTPFFLITTGASDEPSIVRGGGSLGEFAQAIDEKLAQATPTS